VLLLDEPTGALDPHAVTQAEALIRQRLVAGTTVIMVSHDPAQADRMGTLRGHLDRGRLAMVPSS
jgi:ABC-type phosphate transport system ATPase subunit